MKAVAPGNGAVEASGVPARVKGSRFEVAGDGDRSVGQPIEHCAQIRAVGPEEAASLVGGDAEADQFDPGPVDHHVEPVAPGVRIGRRRRDVAGREREA